METDIKYKDNALFKYEDAIDRERQGKTSAHTYQSNQTSYIMPYNVTERQAKRIINNFRVKVAKDKKNLEKELNRVLGWFK